MPNAPDESPATTAVALAADPPPAAPRPRLTPWQRNALREREDTEARRTARVARRLHLEARAMAKLELQERKSFARYAAPGDGTWQWIKDCVVTEDPHTKKFRPFPTHGDLGKYLEILTHAIMDPDPENPLIARERLLALLKSRRMIVTWLVCAIFDWCGIFGEHEYMFVGSRKLGDNEFQGSRELIKRCKTIIRKLRAGPRPKIKASRDVLEFPDRHNVIIAVAQGDDQLRQYAASRILLDEFAFWPEAESTFGGLKPTVENFGQIIAVSTASPSFFWNLTQDKLEALEGSGQSWSGSAGRRERAQLMTGVERWRCGRNGTLVYRIHYTADHRKRDPKWIAAAKRGFSAAAWRREMEIDGETFAGKPVFEDDYNEERHVVRIGDARHPLALDPRRPLLRVWDFGFHHPLCVVGQLYEARQFRFYRAWLGVDTDLKPFASSCLRLCTEIFGRDVRWRDGGDIAGTHKKSTGPSDIELLATLFKLEVRSEKIPVKQSIALVREFLSGTWKRGEPLLLIEENEDTEYLRSCFSGGYHFEPGAETPAEDGYYEHGGDVIRYLVWLFHLEGTAHEAAIDASASADIPDEKIIDDDEAFVGDW